MKRTAAILSGCLAVLTSVAQEPADALRYSWTVPSGTARNQAIGGAMGSLGGDLSAAFVNPAGLAFYRTGDVIFTPSYRFGNNKSTYRDRTERDKDNNVFLGTTGFVVGSGYLGQKKNNAAISLAYNRAANFRSDVLYRAQVTGTSYSLKYLEEIRGLKDPNRVASDFPFGSSLGFNTYWIDTVGGGSSGNYQFQSRAPIGTGLLQEQTIETRGGIDEFVLAGAFSFEDKLFVGGGFTVPVLRYERDASFIEADATANTSNRFNFGSVTEDLSTKGVGINLKAGLIYKPHESWRLGFAFHTPTMYNMTDRYSVTVETDTENYMGYQKQTNEDVAGAPSEFKYYFTSPYRLMGSISYVLREIEDVSKQRGFLTADVEYVNYKAASYQPDEEYGVDQETENYLESLNKAIDNAYKGAFNVRVGGELKFTTIMVRAGASYYGNPYKEINGEKGSRMNVSGGLGYRNKGVFVDLAYVHSLNKDTQFPYRLEDRNLYSGAQVRTTAGNVVATVGFKF